jgi:pyruvate formate lyase activating enzyme
MGKQIEAIKAFEKVEKAAIPNAGTFNLKPVTLCVKYTMVPLEEILERYTVPGELYEKLDGNRVRCVACGHRCPIPDGAPGVCKVRFNKGGILKVPYGYVAGTQCDPIEKKPFFHARPGSLAYSFGMFGCSLHCGFCQNWVTSQTLRDPNSIARPLRTTPSALVQEACNQEAEIVVSTYNEPLISSEWGLAVFKEAKAAGLMTAYVSNGNGTPEVLQYLRPWLDLYKVDLKSFDDRQYRKLGGRLQPVLDTIRSIHEMGIWLEIVTLLVPGFNNSQEELTRLTEFISGVASDIPWHVTAFHKDYKMADPDNTTSADLLRAVEIGKKSGLQYIYAGNLPGRAGKWENTYCPVCSELLIERRGYRILNYHLAAEGRCPSCAQKIPGRWAASFRPQISAYPYSLTR